MTVSVTSSGLPTALGAGTFLLKDFASASNYASVEGMWKAGSIVFLSVYFYDGTSYQAQLWKTDGTTGTVLVKDIAAGSVDIISQNSAAVLGANLLFTVDTGSGDKQLWISDGSNAGTVMLKQINTTASANPGYFVSHGPYVYFVADDGINGRELWRTDGTVGGTIMLTPGPTGFDCNDGCRFLGQGSILFAQSSTYISPNYEKKLIRTDGSAANTISLLGSMSPSSGDLVDFSRSAVSNDGTVFLPADNGAAGWEPAKLTVSGLTIIKDINAGAGSSMGNSSDSRAGSFAKGPSGAIYFAASENGGPRDLWRTDGTAAGTVRVLSRSLNDGLDIDRIGVAGNKLFFGARPIGGGSSRHLQVFFEGIPNVFANESYTRVLELDGPVIAPGTGLNVAP